jgi:NAD+ kinase
MEIACVSSESDRARAALAELEKLYELVAPESCDVLVALGGDGFLLHTMHEHLALGVPIFGMNRGSVGFLLNAFRPDGLPERLAAATRLTVRPLAVRAVATGGEQVDGLAFNEVTTIRDSGQSANIRVSVDGAERLANFVGDGLIVATPAGSTAYNLSAHGPIIPLGSPLLALTPVSPFRPRRWRGALLPDTATVELENLDPARRQLAATADFRELTQVQSMTIAQDRGNAVNLLFDADGSLEERFVSEQFLS